MRDLLSTVTQQLSSRLTHSPSEAIPYGDMLAETLAIARELVSATIPNGESHSPLILADLAAPTPLPPIVARLNSALRSSSEISADIPLEADRAVSDWILSSLEFIDRAVYDRDTFDPVRTGVRQIRERANGAQQKHQSRWSKQLDDRSAIEEARASIESALRESLKSEDNSGISELLAATQRLFDTPLGPGSRPLACETFEPAQVAELRWITDSFAGHLRPEGSLDLADRLDQWLTGAESYIRNELQLRDLNAIDHEAAMSRISATSAALDRARAAINNARAAASAERAKLSETAARRAELSTREAAGDTATNELAKWFKEFADHRKSSSRWWLLGSILSVITTVTILSLWHYHDSSLASTASSLGLSIPLLALAAFLAREGARARQAQLWAEALVAQLRSVRAYGEALNEDHRQRLLSDFGATVFGRFPTGPPNELQTVPAEVMRLAELLATRGNPAP